MSKRLTGQSKAGLEYTEQLKAGLQARVKGLNGAMGVREWVVLSVLTVGDWRPIKGKYQ